MTCKSIAGFSRSPRTSRNEVFLPVPLSCCREVNSDGVTRRAPTVAELNCGVCPALRTPFARRAMRDSTISATRALADCEGRPSNGSLEIQSRRSRQKSLLGSVLSFGEPPAKMDSRSTRASSLGRTVRNEAECRWRVSPDTPNGMRNGQSGYVRRSRLRNGEFERIGPGRGVLQSPP